MDRGRAVFSKLRLQGVLGSPASLRVPSDSGYVQACDNRGATRVLRTISLRADRHGPCSYAKEQKNAHTAGPHIHRARHVRRGAGLLRKEAPPTRRGVAARPVGGPSGRGSAREAEPDRRQQGAAGGEGGGLFLGGGSR